MTQSINQYRWIELAAIAEVDGRPQMHRKRFVLHDDQASIVQWRARFENTDWFTSISYFRDANRKSPAVTPFFLDIDAHEQLDRGREQVLLIADRLQEKLGIAPTSLDIALSGGGFHITVPLVVWNNPMDPGHIRVWEMLTRRLAKDGADLLDLGVYQKQRLWRAMNSYNSKHDRHKVPIEFAELQDLGLAHVLELAQQPRDITTGADPREAPKAVAWLNEQALPWVREQGQRHHATRRTLDRARGWCIPTCIKRIEREGVLQDGTRHQIYFEMARFYRAIGAHPLEVAHRLREVDERHPIRDPDYIDRVAEAAAQYGGWRRPCPHPAMQQHCDPTSCPLKGQR